MKNRIVFTFCFFILGYFGFAQLQSAHWYFGRNAGLDFTNGNPIPVYDGALVTGEGCASIADEQGNLLFYTDGSNVYNRDHNIMPNGVGLNGNPSSSQSAIIVPVPESESRFVIFTVDADDNTNESIATHDADGDGDFVDLAGLQYSVVDMTLNGGLGDVVNSEKNILLELSPDNPNKCSEKISAVLHENDTDVWVVTHYFKSFYAFLVTENGVNENAIVTEIGPEQPESSYPVNARGYMKMSPDGSRLAIAHMSSLQTPFTDDEGNTNGNSIPSNASPGYLGVYDFNDATGEVTNEIVLNQINGERIGTPYGVEFSPNSLFLYSQLDIHDSNNQWTDGYVIQYNLSDSPISSTILSEEGVFVDHGANSLFRSRGSLQLGLDQKIYLATVRNNGIVEDPNLVPSFLNGLDGLALSVINEPNEIGLAANYTHESLVINTSINPNTFVAFGLPPFITSFFLVEIVIEGTLVSGDSCVGTELTFTVETDSTVTQAVWDFGDGSPTVTLGSNESISHVYDTAGEYTATVTITDAVGQELTGTYEIEIFDFPAVQDVALIACDDDADGISVFDLSLANEQIISPSSDYQFSYHLNLDDAEAETDAIENFNSYTNTTPNQIIYARVESEQGCHSIAEITLNTTDEHIVISPFQLCDFENDGVENFNLPLKETEILALEFFSLPDDEYSFTYFETLADATANENAISNINSYQNMELPQTIYVRVDSEFNCEATIEFDLELIPEVEIILEPQYLCPDGSSIINQSVILDAGEGFLSYEWTGLQGSDVGQDVNQSTITVSNPGIYNVTITNNNLCPPKTFSVEVLEADIPEITQILINGNDVTILATGGFMPFEYQLNQSPWQSSNMFNNLAVGDYIANVRNSLGCLNSRGFGIFVIPNTITPNGDGFNDAWKIPGLRNFRNVKIQIFDRYGKLIKGFTYNPTSNGGGEGIENFSDINVNPGAASNAEELWDGHYLGRPVPTTSYWYILELEDGRKFTGWLLVKNI